MTLINLIIFIYYRINHDIKLFTKKLQNILILFILLLIIIVQTCKIFE